MDNALLVGIRQVAPTLPWYIRAYTTKYVTGGYRVKFYGMSDKPAKLKQKLKSIGFDVEIRIMISTRPSVVIITKTEW